MWNTLKYMLVHQLCLQEVGKYYSDFIAALRDNDHNKGKYSLLIIH